MSLSKVNSTCKPCGKRFNASLSKIVVLKPCGHLCHEKCLSPENNQCSICQVTINNKVLEHELLIGSQDLTDVKSLKRTHFQPKFFDHLRAFCRIPFVAFYFLLLYKEYVYKSVTIYSIKRFLSKILSVLSIKVNFIGGEKLDSSMPKIYVCNHVAYHDTLILPLYITAGMLASQGGMNNLLSPVMASGVSVLVIDRGHSKNNTVSQMNAFIADKKESLFCFPQGLFGSYNTLSKFRTGAFATNYAVQPVVLKYKQDISSISIYQTLCFPRVDVDLIVLDVQHKQEEETVEEFAERIRVLMAKSGDFQLSRVDSHDVRE